MNDLDQTAADINTIGFFLARRDIPELTGEALRAKCGAERADLLILFGGSIPFGCDEAARAFRNGIAKRLMIAGGEGHTTDFLRRAINDRCPEISVKGRAEADIINDYFKLRHGLTGCLIERRSTNCGNNVSFALELALDLGIDTGSVIIMQDSTMQLRMDAVFRKTWAAELKSELINYAAYIPELEARDGRLRFKNSGIWGLWSVSHYITLALGEIPRLSDTPEGYGPRGRNYIAHVDIPDNVRAAFNRLREVYPDSVRPEWRGNPA